LSDPWPDNVSRCQLCEQRIEWKTSVSGLRIPLDPQPNPLGTLRLLTSGHVQVIPVEERGTLTEPRPRYMSHWQSCPAAAAARQGKPRDDDG
jgi:hypothetical protein